MSQFPYYTEPSHDAGSTTTAGRDTATSVAEGRMIVDVVDRIFLLEPKRLVGLPCRNVRYKIK